MIEDIYWTEKWRPDTLDDIIGNEEVVSAMQDWKETGDMPNLLFTGPSGTGKTAISTAFAKDFYGDDWRSNFLELNASDDRGIDVVRDRIKSYAKQAPAGPYPFKIIFLDECDNLTNDSYAALRRVMEDYSENTRFILSCNYLNEIHDAIQSRCVVFSVDALGRSEVIQILEKVADGEDLDYDYKGLEMIADYASGDARRAINTLQAASTGNEVNIETLDKVVGVVDEDLVEEIIDLSVGSQVGKAQEMLTVDLLKQGVDARRICDTFLRVLKRGNLPPDVKMKAIHQLGETEYRISTGCSAHIQFNAYLAHLSVIRHMSLPHYEES